MSAFGGLILTNKGRALQAKAQTGTQLQFTKIKVGDGQLGGQSITELTGLIHEVKSLSATKFKVLPGGKAVVGCVLSNGGLLTGFYWRELGVYAIDPVDGEILYCYGNAGANAEYIPADGGADILEKAIDVITIIGNASNVSATIEQSQIYVTPQDLEGKVDRVEGKGLSTEDFTTTEKNKLAGIAPGATAVIVNNTLTSTSTAQALSAAQGKVLKDAADAHGADTTKHVGYIVGNSIFNSTSGVTITHNLGHTNYKVEITPTSNPNGYLGEIYVTKNINSVIVYCSGSTTTTTFDYVFYLI